MLQKEFNFNSLMMRDEDGRYRVATSEEIIEGAKLELKKQFSRGATLDSPEKTKDLLQLCLAQREHEVFSILWLDLCVVLRNVELRYPDRLLMRIRRRQLHIRTITVGASS